MGKECCSRLYRRLRRGRKYEFPQNVCVGDYALPCRKLKMFLLSHLLFSVLVCRLLFRTLISKFYYEFFFFKTKKRQCSTPLFNIRTSNFLVEAERFFFIIMIIITVIIITMIITINIIYIFIIVIIIIIYLLIYLFFAVCA